MKYINLKYTPCVQQNFYTFIFFKNHSKTLEYICDPLTARRACAIYYLTGATWCFKSIKNAINLLL